MCIHAVSLPLTHILSLGKCFFLVLFFFSPVTQNFNGVENPSYPGSNGSMLFTSVINQTDACSLEHFLHLSRGRRGRKVNILWCHPTK